MDLNALKPTGEPSSGVASPVVSGSKSPKPEQATPRIAHDVVDLSNSVRVKAAENALIARNNRNVRSGSHVYHDETTNQFVVQIVNDNNEVIRQLPMEEALRISARFREVTGLIFDHSV